MAPTRPRRASGRCPSSTCVAWRRSVSASRSPTSRRTKPRSTRSAPPSSRSGSSGRARPARRGAAGRHCGGAPRSAACLLARGGRHVVCPMRWRSRTAAPVVPQAAGGRRRALMADERSTASRPMPSCAPTRGAAKAPTAGRRTMRRDGACGRPPATRGDRWRPSPSTPPTGGIPRSAGAWCCPTATTSRRPRRRAAMTRRSRSGSSSPTAATRRCSGIAPTSATACCATTRAGKRLQPGLRGDRGLGAGKIPRYLLIVASPADIPWSAQLRMQLDACVGRLDLDDAGLANYVRALRDDWKDARRDTTRPLVWAVDHGYPDITRLMRKVDRREGGGQADRGRRVRHEGRRPHGREGHRRGARRRPGRRAGPHSSSRRATARRSR